MKRLVLVGGGHAHVEVLRELAQRRDDRWDVALVTPFPALLYSGMVPGYIAGHYVLGECAIDLAALASRAHAALVQTLASLVSATAKEVICANGTVLPYDVLSLDVGSVPLVGRASGVERHAIVMRPLEKMVKGWDGVLARALEGRVAAVTVVGAGAAGVELALAMEHRLRREVAGPAPHVRIVSNTASLLAEFSFGARWRLRRHLQLRGIGLHLGHAVTEVGADYVRLEGGIEFATDAVFWAAGAAAPEWIRDSGLAADDRGFLLTNELLQSLSHPGVFGAGDCATQHGHPNPRAGVFAVRAAPVLAANLAAALEGRALQPYIAQKRFLALVSSGDRNAVGNWNGLGWQGRWAWRWKDRIDRRFVARYGGERA